MKKQNKTKPETELCYRYIFIFLFIDQFIMGKLSSIFAFPYLFYICFSILSSKFKLKLNLGLKGMSSSCARGDLG